MELISVIVPIYKVEQYLEKCVTSIVTQTYENLEIILVDDGSPDHCPKLCDEWAVRDERIKVIHKKNGGLSDARNAGMEIATGDYIAFVDSDDWIEPRFLEELYQTLIQEKADIVGCGISYVNNNGGLIRCRTCSQPLMNMTKMEALRQLIMETEVSQTVWNKLYKRDILQGVLFEVGKCHEDDFWTYQIFDRATKITMIQESLYNYLQRESSIMGVGYSLKRMDSLEAHFLRMKYLQKYKDLSNLLGVFLMYDSMFHFQSAIKYLKADDRERVTTYVKQIMQTLPSCKTYGSIVPYTYKIWFIAFRKFPYVTARIRNMLNIGLQ